MILIGKKKSSSEESVRYSSGEKHTHTQKSSKNGKDLKPSNQDQKIKNPKF